MDNKARVLLHIVAIVFQTAVFAQTVEPHFRVSQVYEFIQTKEGDTCWNGNFNQVTYRGQWSTYYYSGSSAWLELNQYDECPIWTSRPRDEYWSYTEWPTLEADSWTFESWYRAGDYNERWTVGQPITPDYRWLWGRCQDSDTTVGSEHGLTWENTRDYFRDLQLEMATGGNPGETHDNNLFRLSVTA